MLEILKKLSELLPVSKREYTENMKNIVLALQGLAESDANHCQIETNLIQFLQKKSNKPAPKKSKNDLNMYG